MDIWIGLADAAPVEDDGEIGGAFVHVLAPAEDVHDLRAAAAEALLEHGFEIVSLEDAEPVRDRVRTRSIATDLLELALDAALDGTARLSAFNTYPPDDHPDPESVVADAVGSKRFSMALAQEDRTLVNVRGASDWHETNGYVVGLASEWALLQLVDRCGCEDGFAAIKLESVAEIVPVSAEDSFLPAVVRTRPIAPRAPAVDLSEVRRLLESAQRESALISIATDEMDPGAFWIVRLAELDDEGADLRSVSATGEWYDGERCDYESITRIGFGGRYEEALALAAGPDPGRVRAQPPALREPPTHRADARHGGVVEQVPRP